MLVEISVKKARRDPARAIQATGAVIAPLWDRGIILGENYYTAHSFRILIATWLRTHRVGVLKTCDVSIFARNLRRDGAPR